MTNLIGTYVHPFSANHLWICTDTILDNSSIPSPDDFSGPDISLIRVLGSTVELQVGTPFTSSSVPIAYTPGLNPIRGSISNLPAFSVTATNTIPSNFSIDSAAYAAAGATRMWHANDVEIANGRVTQLNGALGNIDLPLSTAFVAQWDNAAVNTGTVAPAVLNDYAGAKSFSLGQGSTSTMAVFDTGVSVTPSTAITGSDAFTLFALVKVTQFDRNIPLVAFGDNNNSTTTGHVLLLSGDGLLSVRLGRTAGVYNYGAFPAGWNIITVTKPASTAYNSGLVVLVNGVPVAQTSVSGPSNTSTGGLVDERIVIGSYPNNTNATTISDTNAALTNEMAAIVLAADASSTAVVNAIGAQLYADYGTELSLPAWTNWAGSGGGSGPTEEFTFLNATIFDSEPSKIYLSFSRNIASTSSLSASLGTVDRVSLIGATVILQMSRFYEPGESVSITGTFLSTGFPNVVLTNQSVTNEVT